MHNWYDWCWQKLMVIQCSMPGFSTYSFVRNIYIMCTDCEAIIGEYKRQVYRLRVCLIMERAGKPTANLSIRALKYIADSFKVGMLPIDCAKYLGAFEEVWKTNAGASDACNHSVQPA